MVLNLYTQIRILRDQYSYLRRLGNGYGKTWEIITKILRLRGLSVKINSSLQDVFLE